MSIKEHYLNLFRAFKWYKLLLCFIFSMAISFLIVFPFILIMINLLFLYVRFIYLFLFIMVLFLSGFWVLTIFWFVKTLNHYDLERPLNTWYFIKTLGVLLAVITFIVGTVIVIVLTPYFIT